MQKKLINYKEIADFPEFCHRAREAAGDYRYIAARERRCFNLMCGYWTGDWNLLTVSGLLANVGKVVEEYMRTGEFPRVLILDDLAVYGRSISKSVSQFRDAVLDRLRAEHAGEFREEQFAGAFQRNVDVWVYAASEKARLLAAGVFTFRTFSGKFSSMRAIHDMSLLFSHVLTDSGIPNTSFSLSVRSEALWEKLLEEDQELPFGWSRVSLRCEGERAVVYLKANGYRSIESFKTLRFFPDREKSVSQVTSFPLLGTLDGPAARDLCRKGVQLAREENLPETERLLKETHQYLQPLKVQLFVFLTSVLDFHDFCEDFLNREDREAVQNEMRCDLLKTVSNFGGGKALLGEFRRLVFDKALRERLRGLLNGCRRRGILWNDSPAVVGNLDIQMEDTKEGEECSEEVSRYIWQLGVQDEMNAAPVVGRPYWFEPLDYQEGARSFHRILRDLSDGLTARKLCGLTAALLAAMDRGLGGPLARVEEDSETEFRLKVGELSIFRPMKKHAASIPALARVEEFYYLRYRTRKEAVTAFLEKYGPRDEELLEIYEYGQTFADWNFGNLTRLYGTRQETADRKAQAEEFLFGWQKEYNRE